MDPNPDRPGVFCPLINHSSRRANVGMFAVFYRGEIRILFLATREIAADEELRFDYGTELMDDWILGRFPWLRE